jgi:flagellar basal body-associated protein FliL
MTESEKKKSPFLVVALTLILGLGGGAAAMAYLRPTPPKGPESETASSVKAVLHLETFTVDLSSPEQKAYLRVGIDVGLAHDLKGQEDGGTPTALVRDTILGVLMAARPDDLISSEGKQKLKDQILSALRHRAPGFGAQEIYYTEFLMQR